MGTHKVEEDSPRSRKIYAYDLVGAKIGRKVTPVVTKRVLSAGSRGLSERMLPGPSAFFLSLSEFAKYLLLMYEDRETDKEWIIGRSTCIRVQPKSILFLI